MEKEKAIELAKEIVKLDTLRDELWETLIGLKGSHAFEILRRIQNEGFKGGNL